MNTGKLFLSMLLAALLGGAISIAGYKYLAGDSNEQSFQDKQQVVLSRFENRGDSTGNATVNSSATETKRYEIPAGLNFVAAAEKVTPAVVHIKTTYDGTAAQYGRNSIEDMLRNFFGDGGEDGYYGNRGQRMSSGSGVIITDDGYIATNNHVVEDASRIEVVLNDKRSFDATIVGTDPNTDLALIKIEGNSLPFVPFGNSDEVKIGEWVLAVGNPFDLTSTVTAGIVSAKARNINILRSRTRSNYSIESFIQTDAAVNPGNSGGALVDLEGKLIGINTAIATNTGSYSGYSFAVPVSLVKKVMDDLLSYGEVQRALMGVSIVDVNAELAEMEDLDEVEGVFIMGVNPGSGADDAGIVRGDIILGINDIAVNNVSELQEIVAQNRPGDQVKVKLKRNDTIEEVMVTLKNRQQTTEIITRADREKGMVSELGAEVVDLEAEELAELGLNSGIKVVELKEGKLKAANVQEGFIITHIDKRPVSSTDNLREMLSNIDGGVLIEGIYPDGEKAYYGIGF